MYQIRLRGSGKLKLTRSMKLSPDNPGNPKQTWMDGLGEGVCKKVSGSHSEGTLPRTVLQYMRIESICGATT